jgi:hypothetical protein
MRTVVLRETLLKPSAVLGLVHRVPERRVEEADAFQVLVRLREAVAADGTAMTRFRP